MTPAFSICVYCGSKPGTQPEFAQAAQAVGTWIGKHRGQLIYGGGTTGLMGIVAQATQLAGGEVIGIIPQALMQRERVIESSHELIVVPTMHERKRMMAERADAFLALPGGIGTFEELFEIWTWRQLGYHDKPVGLLNVNSFYDGLLAFMNTTVETQFLSSSHLSLIEIQNDPDLLLKNLVQSAGLSLAPHLAQV